MSEHDCESEISKGVDVTEALDESNVKNFSNKIIAPKDPGFRAGCPEASKINIGESNCAMRPRDQVESTEEEGVGLATSSHFTDSPSVQVDNVRVYPAGAYRSSLRPVMY